MVLNDFKGVDQFLQDAQNIYGELYQVGGKHPFEFLQKIFDSTRQQIHTRHNLKGVQEALAEKGLVPIVSVNTDGPPEMPAKKLDKRNKATPKNNNNSDDDDDDDKKGKTIPSQRSVNSIMNDSKYVRGANDFIKNWQI